MSLQQSATMLHVEPNAIPGAATDYLGPRRPITPFAMLRQLSAESEGFASGCIQMAKSLESRRQVVIAANMSENAQGLPRMTCWTCTHDEQGIDLLPLVIGQSNSVVIDADPWVNQLIGTGANGDALIVCDPWGDNDLFCRALRIAGHREVATIAITTDQPNLLAVLAHHSIRVPVTAPFRREFVITALRHLVQTAGVSLIPTQRRVTGPLRQLAFD